MYLINASAARLRGCAEKELIGLSIADTYVPAERDESGKDSTEAKQGVLRIQRQFLRKNNEVVPVEISLSPLAKTITKRL